MPRPRPRPQRCYEQKQYKQGVKYADRILQRAEYADHGGACAGGRGGAVMPRPCMCAREPMCVCVCEREGPLQSLFSLLFSLLWEGAQQSRFSL